MTHTERRPVGDFEAVILLPRQYLVRDTNQPDYFHLLSPDGSGGWTCSDPHCQLPPGETVCEHARLATGYLRRDDEDDPGPVLAASELGQERGCRAGRAHLHVV